MLSSFPYRTLKGLWANEHVPAYQCPAGHGFLQNVRYAPFGTSVPNGVELKGLGPVGVSIPYTVFYSGEPIPEPKNPYVALGPAKVGSSATNWTTGSAFYKVILHCTNAGS